MINQSGAESAIEDCGVDTPLAIGQDADDASTWKALGGKYNSIIIGDGAGILVHKIYPSAFPDSEDEIVNVVESLLQ